MARCATHEIKCSRPLPAAGGLLRRGSVCNTCIVHMYMHCESGMWNAECGIGKQSKKFNEILLMKNCFQQNENFWRCKPLFNKQLVHVPPVHM